MTRKRHGERPGARGRAIVNTEGATGAWAKRKRYVPACRRAFIAGIIASLLFPTALLGGAWAAGEPAPDITLKTENGTFRLADQKGKVVVLYFSFPG